MRLNQLTALDVVGDGLDLLVTEAIAERGHPAAAVPNLLLEGSSTTTDAYGTFQGPAEVMGPDRVLFATDAGPFHHPAINMLKIDLLSMSRDWKEQILGGNALRVLGRSPDTVGRAPDHRRGVYVTAMGTLEYPTPALIQ